MDAIFDDGTAHDQRAWFDQDYSGDGDLLREQGWCHIRCVGCSGVLGRLFSQDGRVFADSFSAGYRAEAGSRFPLPCSTCAVVRASNTPKSLARRAFRGDGALAH